MITGFSESGRILLPTAISMAPARYAVVSAGDQSRLTPARILAHIGGISLSVEDPLYTQWVLFFIFNVGRRGRDLSKGVADRGRVPGISH